MCQRLLKAGRRASNIPDASASCATTDQKKRTAMKSRITEERMSFENLALIRRMRPRVGRLSSSETRGTK